MLGGLAIFSFLAAPIQELAAAIARDSGGGRHGIALLVAALGVGTLAGVPLQRRLFRTHARPAIVLPTVTALFAAGVAVIALTSSFAVVLAAMVVCGACWCIAYTVAMTGSQMLPPPELQGRVLGLLQLVTAGGLALGPVVAGLLAELVGLDDALLIAAGALAALAIAGAVRPATAVDRGFQRVEHDSHDPARL